MAIIEKTGKVIPPPEVERKLAEFRDDIRRPEKVFGRCCLTGEWGEVVAIDLGDVSINAPDTSKGVALDPETGQVSFSFWKPVVFQNQALFSKPALKALIKILNTEAAVIPSFTPHLIYKWQVLYADGSAATQYIFDPVTGEEVEVNSKYVDFDRIAQFSVVARFTDAGDLPTYTFVKTTGKFYKNGQELDLMYDGDYLPDSRVVYARKVHHTWGSILNPKGLNRMIQDASTSVLQLLGWKVGGLQGPGPGAIIAIDDRGNWRPWEYLE